MKTKVKKFSHKLLALFLAVLMGVTCFSVAIPVSAASADVEYYDDAVEYNSLAWAVLSDEQTATALLDYLDVLLADVGPQLDVTLANALPSSGIYYYSPSSRSIELNVGGIIKASIPVKLHSVDEALETIEGVNSVIGSYSGVIGDAGNLKLGATAGMRRNNTSSCEIIKGVLGILQQNSADWAGADVLGEFLRGGFDLGTVSTFVDIDIYGMIGGLLGADDGYESNLVYNVVQALLFNNTNWFTDEEKAAYKSNPASFVYDEVLLDKMTTKFLRQINVEVTYKGGLDDDNTVSSKVRYQAIKDKTAEINSTTSKNYTFKEAATALGYDPELVYTEDGNVCLFVYGTNDDGTVAEDADAIHLDSSSTLFTFGYEALRLAWETVLRDTVSTIRVNYSVERGHGTNFDNGYYYWAKSNIPGGWDVNNLAEMYSEANINSWAEAIYESYDATSPEEFLGWVKDNYVFDREAAEDSTGAWDDIDATTLFNKVRYSPLADYGFNMETGPINLYLMQTGTPNLNAFFESYSDYNSLAAGLNDALVAVVKDLFVDNATRPNVYGDNNLPTLATINPSVIDDATIRSITSTLVGNALKVFQYAADATDSNILKAFYDDKGAGTQLTEETFEEAMIPFLIACIGQVNLNGYKMTQYIHPEDWDACKDAEAVIFVALREYLSYILPEKNYNTLAQGVNSDGSLQGDTITATLDDAILPMARDAVVYVMQGYVPVTDASGNAYDVYTRPVDDDTTIFELLNSVVCYYGGEYTFKNSSIPKNVGAMGVGALLGVCGSDGRSLITMDNTLWQNIDLVANHLMPVLGTLQYGNSDKYEEFNSYELIYNDIVQGVLEIGNSSIHTSGMGGVSNFLYRLLTIVSAEPIQSTPVTLTVYDLVRDLFNALFGARYEGQGYTEIVPARSSSHPFDDVVQKNVLVGTDGNNVGILQKMICNLVEFTGRSGGDANTYPDSILRGAMFAVKAVQSFIPNILTSLGDHQLGLGTASYDQRVMESCASGSSYDTTVTFTNNSAGVNKAYVDGTDNSIVQLSRYFMKVKSVSVESSTGTQCSVSGIDPSKVIEPGEKVTYTAASVYQPDEQQSTSVAATFTYDICDDTGKVLYPDLTTTTYQYLTGAAGWEDAVYPNGSTTLNASFGSSDRNQVRTVNGYNIYSSRAFRDNAMMVIYPEYIVLATSNLGAINNYQLRLMDNTDGAFTSDGTHGMDGFFCFDEKTVYDDNTSSQVAVNRLNAIPIYNKETGDIIKYGKYDYSLDGGKSWNRNGVAGYTQEEVNSIVQSNTNVSVRDHVVYTLQEAINGGIVAAYHKNAAGFVEYLYLKTGAENTEFRYDQLLGNISLRGPVDGIYINQGKINVPYKGWFGGTDNIDTSNLFVYDGETPIQAGTYDVNLTVYTSNSSNNLGDGLSGTGAGSGRLINENGQGCKLVIGDDSSTASLDQSYNNLSDVLANYTDADFLDLGVKDLAKDALLNALSTQASVLTPETAIALSDKTVLSPVTTVVATEYGDRAYVPFTTSNATQLGMPTSVQAEAYQKDDSDIYYFDEACTMPIYSDTPLTVDLVSDGKDPAGMAVIEGTGADAGKYWLRNEPSYETQWNTTAYDTPWREYVTDEFGQRVQATNSAGDLLYEQVTYVYRNSLGNKVNSDFDWAAKFPETSYQMIENTGSGEDNRGLYTQAADYLAYVEEQVYAGINPQVANDLLTKISIVRNNMNNNNFEVVTYNEMVGLAQNAEANYTVNIPYTYEEPVIGEDGQPVIGEDGTPETVTKSEVANVPFSEYNGYMNNEDIIVDEGSITVSSSLSSTQVAEYVREFDTYMANVLERGYMGSQLEQEIACASGNPYTAMTATVEENEDGAVVSGTVKFDSDATVPFGALDEEGYLVNEGPVIYADNLWNTYVTALANAVRIATLGNGDYAYKESGIFDYDNKDLYECNNTSCYTADTTLQVAEVALETATNLNVAYSESGYVTVDGVQVDTQKPYAVAKGSTVVLDAVATGSSALKGFAEDYIYTAENEEGETYYALSAKGDSMTVTPIFESTGVNVTASLVIATDNKGTTANSGVTGQYTITLYEQGTENMVGTPQVFDLTAEANSFTLEAVPAGTYDMVISSEFAISRTVTLIVGSSDITGPAIPMIVCNYNGDTGISANDALAVYAEAAAGTNDQRYNLNGDTGISANDALIVYACAAGTIDMPAITIQ